MKILTNPKLEEVKAIDTDSVVVTHNGVFHAHEVFAIALRPHMNFVIRTRDESILELAKEKGWFIVDVGLGEFDHHRYRGFKNLRDMFGDESDWYRFYTTSNVVLEQLLLSIAKQDCGESDVVDYVNNHIKNFVPNWNENLSDVNFSKQFGLGVDFAKRVLDDPDPWMLVKHLQIDKENATKEAVSLVEDALEKARIKKQNFIILDKFCPWGEVVCIHNEEEYFVGESPNDLKPLYIYFVIYPEMGSSNWRLQAVNRTPGTFDRWIDIDIQVGEFDSYFVHPNKFLAGFPNKEKAIECAMHLIARRLT